MLFAVAEVMFQMVALGLEGVVVLVFNLPTRAARGDDAGDVFVGDLKIGDEGVFIKNFALLVGDGRLAPVDLQGTFALDQRNLVGIPVGVMFPLVFLVLHTHLEGVDVLAGFQIRHPLVKVGVGIGFADKDEMKAVEQRAPTEGLAGV